MNVLSRVIHAGKNPLRRLSAIRVVAAASTLMALGAGCAAAATITATSTSGAIMKSFTGPWFGLTDKAGTLATISWSSGPNSADGMSFCNPPCPFGPEPKFDAQKDQGGNFQSLKPRTFTGFTKSDTGPLGSTTITKGEGASQLGNGNLSSGSIRRIANGQPQPLPDTIRAEFTLTADGTLGKAKDGVNPSWVSTATGNDPWFLLPSDFQQAGIESTFDLFVPFGLEQAAFSALGSVELTASYESATGIVPLLDILLNSSGPAVTPGILPSLQFYELVRSAGSGSAIYEPADIARISTLLRSNLSNGALSGPLNFGVLLPSLPVPTTAIDSNGALAAIHVTATATDAAVAPEPSSWMLVFAGIGLVSIRFCGRRTLAVPARHIYRGRNNIALAMFSMSKSDPLGKSASPRRAGCF